MPQTPDTFYPVAVIEDRYSGSYAGAPWIAIGQSDKREHDEPGRRYINRIEWVLDGAHGSDTDAMDFWGSPPEWVAVGNSPEEAIKNLISGIRPKCWPEF